MDSIAVDILRNYGVKENIYVGDYVPETDPQIIAAVVEWRKNLT